MKKKIYILFIVNFFLLGFILFGFLNLTLAVSYPDGTLIYAMEERILGTYSPVTVYLIENGYRRPFPSHDIFIAHGYKMWDRDPITGDYVDTIIDVTLEELNSYPLGLPMTMPEEKTTPLDPILEKPPQEEQKQPEEEFEKSQKENQQENEIIGTLAVSGAFRDCPSTDCKLIRYYAETVKIRIINIDDSNEWYQVKANDDHGDEITGWMHYSLFTQDLRDSVLNINQDSPEESESNIEIIAEGKLDSVFLFFQNKISQIELIVASVFIILLMVVFLFRRKIKRFLKNIAISKRKKRKTFIPKIFDIIFQYIKNLLRIKRTKFPAKRIIFIVVIGSILIGSTVFGFGKYQKFIDEKRELEFKLAESVQESGQLQEELVETQEGKEEAEQKAKEEAAKKVKAKQEAQQEAIKRSQAEARAKQEEFEKNLKEQQLSEKEAEEKRMNADNDGDGLTYREELSKGTSDLNPDSDSDGIIDSKDTHPAGGGRNMPQTFAWSYGGYNWTWIESIHEDWYDYYKAKPTRSSLQSVEYITSDDPFIKKISKKISEGANTNGDIGEVWLAISFVQNLPYVDDVFTGYDEYPKYPVETFFEKNGDCEDTSYLTASIIDAMGYGSVLILLPEHMAVGIYMDCDTSGTYYEFDGRCYYYVETTSKDWAGGEIPDRYRNTRATLIKIPSGKTVNAYPQYKKPCYSSSEFPGYYTDGNDYYRDSQCQNITSCLRYSDYYYNYKNEVFYWDSSCNQIVVKGCAKATSYPGYFTNGLDYYYDSRCTQKARICSPSSIYSDRYWDGEYSYWDSSCTQKVVSWCSKSTYHPGYFFSSLDYKYYSDYQCTQKVDI